MQVGKTQKKVLLVDDEKDILDFLERVLRRQYAITRCDSATEALELLQTETYDLVITDQMMPRTTGLELLREAKKRYPKMKRLLISGYTELSDIDTAIQAGVLERYLLKPVDSRRVLELVQATLDS